MNKEFIKDWGLPVLSLLLGVIGIVTIFFPDGTKNNINLLIFFSTLILVLLIITFLYLYNLIKQEGYFFLLDFNAIKEKITSYSTNIDYPSILFCGSFNEEIIKPIYETLGNTKLSKSVKLISTNPEDYNNRYRLSIDFKKIIFESEAKQEDNIFSHRFYNENQIVNIFVANSEREHSRVIFFWKTKNHLEESFQGIEIKNNDIKFNLEDIYNNSFSMNIEGFQDSTICNTIDEINKLWKPFKEGFFSPIIPPPNDPIIRKKWRDLILQNFNNFALGILKNDGYDNMQITWNLTLNSLIDFENFKEWLDCQFIIASKTKLTVNRYLLVNSALYKNDEQYKNIVKFISDYLEPRAINSNGNYILNYIDSAGLSNIVKNDFAFLSNKSSEIVQSAIIDNSTQPEVLKIYFSKNFNSVNVVKNKIDIISTRKNFKTLSEFINSITL